MKYIISLILIGIVALSTTIDTGGPSYNEEDKVQDIVLQLGGEELPHKADRSMEGVSVKKGMELLTIGITTDSKNKKTKKQSAHFNCTSCHNMLLEDPDLSVSDPQARLDYAVKNGLPFLQGTTFYGIINRTTFYNGDYQKKYGDLVEPAKEDIREAIQICATVCAQGRTLEDWEVESILAYYEETGLKMKDLSLNDEENQIINDALNESSNKSKALSIIESKYMKASPAHFVRPPDNRAEGPTEIVKTDINNGKAIYEHSCLHCHEDQRYSLFHLGKDQISKDFLDKHFNKYNRYSTYQVVRWGTSPIPGKKSYMPNYTQERMSVQQLEDLKAYLATKNKK